MNPLPVAATGLAAKMCRIFQKQWAPHTKSRALLSTNCQLLHKQQTSVVWAQLLATYYNSIVWRHNHSDLYWLIRCRATAFRQTFCLVQVFTLMALSCLTVFPPPIQRDVCLSANDWLRFSVAVGYCKSW